MYYYSLFFFSSKLYESENPIINLLFLKNKLNIHLNLIKIFDFITSNKNL